MELDEVSWKQVVPLFFVCTTVLLMWGVWTVDVTVTGIISITGIPEQLVGQSLVFERMSPRVTYHLGLLGIMGSYILISVIATAGWMRE